MYKIGNLQNIAKQVEKEIKSLEAQMFSELNKLANTHPEKSQEIKQAFKKLTQATTEEEKTSAINEITSLCQSIS